MKNRLLAALRFAAAAVAGYAVIVVGTTLTLEGLLDGVSYRESSPGELAAAAVGGIISGLLGGYVAAWIGGRRPVTHAAAVLIFLTIDTTWVVTSGVSTDPAWFDLAAGGSLMAAAVAGGFARRHLLMRGARSPAPELVDRTG